MTSRRSDFASVIREFGMANQLAEANLDQLERELGIDLGRRNDDEGEDEQYSRQFDEAIQNEAEEMSRHYRVFYCLEKTVRELISDSLEDAESANWWDSGRVPQKIHDDVADRIKREMASGMTIRSEAPIDFTTFGELGQIIKKNWDVFGGIFKNDRAVERVLTNLNMLRGPIAHCSPLAEDEVLRLELSLRDWFRQME